MKGIIRFSMFIAAELYIGLQIYNAAILKSFTTVGPRGGGNLVSLESEPVSFWVASICALVLFLLLGWFIVIEVCFEVDKKIKEFGGNYNINTLKAIIRSWRNTTNNKIKRDRRSRRPRI